MKKQKNSRRPDPRFTVNRYSFNIKRGIRALPIPTDNE
jgi:hypothetical protein